MARPRSDRAQYLGHSLQKVVYLISNLLSNNPYLNYTYNYSVEG